MKDVKLKDVATETLSVVKVSTENVQKRNVCYEELSQSSHSTTNTPTSFFFLIHAYYYCKKYQGNAYEIQYILSVEGNEFMIILTPHDRTTTLISRPNQPRISTQMIKTKGTFFAITL